MVNKKKKQEEEFEKLVQLKEENKRVQSFMLKMQLESLIKAIKEDDMKTYKKLVKIDHMLPHYLYCNLYYPIHVACEFGRLEITKHMVEEARVNLDAQCNVTGYTPLMYACQTAQTHIVEYLSQSRIGADLAVRSTLQRRDDYQTTTILNDSIGSEEEDQMS